MAGVNATKVAGLPVPPGRGFQHVRLRDQQGKPRRKARALRAGCVQLPNILRGDVRVGAHVNDVDATHVVDLLEVLEGPGNDFLRDVRLAQSGLIRHQKASRRVLIAVQPPERVLSSRSLEVAEP